MARSKQGSEEHSAAVAGFEALGICQQLAEAAVALGWKEPTSIQQQALPHLLQGAVMLRKRTAPDTRPMTYLRWRCRQRCHWPGTDRLRQDRSLCDAHPAGE